MQLVTKEGEEFFANITVYDKRNQIFDNFSSVLMVWKSSIEDVDFQTATDYFVPCGQSQQRKHIGESWWFYWFI